MLQKPQTLAVVRSCSHVPVNAVTPCFLNSLPICRLPEPMSATKWPFSATHQVPEPCAGRRATRPRVVRRIADVAGLLLVGIRDSAPCGGVFGIDAQLPWLAIVLASLLVPLIRSCLGCRLPRQSVSLGASCGSFYTIVVL